MTDQFHRLLMRVQKPARYVGGEYNQIIKDKKDVDVRVAFCFPDTYEIGMSNIGMRILYGVMNEMSGVWCERVFAPWGDMEDKMRAHGLPLWALESHDAVRDFDLVAFTLGYEMCYSNVLNMLELAQIPLLSKTAADWKISFLPAASVRSTRSRWRILLTSFPSEKGRKARRRSSNATAPQKSRG